MSRGEEAVEWVAELLRQLGPTREEVADSLRKAGITGLPDNVFEDPIANYLKANGVTSPEVDLEQVALDAYENPDMTDGPFRVRLPRPVREFILAFEEGAYADLRAEVNV
ncbi:hypothetical protein GCM10010172_80230 [Paractinoplanes ferrugineus]|uniref:Uncharacterized protein n=1 Tax=Paractinoplanes ferrugineus TaxID=113564 RepID=A0A919JAZ2_9ACTN|nr:hypothetical protein [Actinoplanes ferrugineus]GIE16739.1 hypothetical protein Afe05nite_85790 [Actinoplanes ferrugineus]